MAIKAKFVGREKLTQKLREIAPAVEVEYAKAIETGAKELADAIRARAPRGTKGEYANSIEAARVADRPGQKMVGIEQTKDPNAWGIFANYIWRFLEYGTKAHIIKPKRTKRLVFETSDGETVSASQVKHPGQTARPHIFPTYRAMRKRVRSRVTRAINKAVKKVASGS